MTLVTGTGNYLWCRRSVQYLLACYEEKNQLTLATPAILIQHNIIYIYIYIYIHNIYIHNIYIYI